MGGKPRNTIGLARNLRQREAAGLARKQRGRSRRQAPHLPSLWHDAPDAPQPLSRASVEQLHP